jgi:hypothetical protein
MKGPLFGKKKKKVPLKLKNTHISLKINGAFPPI